MPQLTRTVAIGRDCGARVDDVRFVGVGGGVARGEAGKSAREERQEHRECGDVGSPVGCDHRVSPSPRLPSEDCPSQWADHRVVLGRASSTKSGRAALEEELAARFAAGDAEMVSRIPGELALLGEAEAEA